MCNVVVGMGIVGTALMRLIAFEYDAFGVDIEKTDMPAEVRTLHLCFPYSDAFIPEAVRYIKDAEPELCIIHSTVIPGTTERIASRTDCKLAYSPIRGRHNTMLLDILKYKKFVAGIDLDSRKTATAFLESINLVVEYFNSCRALELAKLIETSYSGLLIAWAQEMARYADAVNAGYFDVMRFMADIPYLPPVIFQPGYIGGKCIIPNLALLREVKLSPFVESIIGSNSQMKSSEEQLYPIKR